jgi:hypothetical protein
VLAHQADGGNCPKLRQFEIFYSLILQFVICLVLYGMMIENKPSCGVHKEIKQGPIGNSFVVAIILNSGGLVTRLRAGAWVLNEKPVVILLDVTTFLWEL